MAVTVRIAAVLLVALISMHACQAGKTFVWSGGNTNFSNADNWQGSVVPARNSSVCDTTFGSETTNIVSQLDATEYNVGQVLNLPPNGVLFLAADNTVLTFTDFESSGASCGGGSAVWSGGLQPEQRNDFYCHTNWQLSNKNPVDGPPCATDNVKFNDGTTYSIQVAPNVSLVELAQLSFGGKTITSSSPADLNSLLPQIDLVNLPGTVYIGADGVNICDELGQSDANQNCYCYSSCPTMPMMVKQQQQIRLALQTKAAEILNTASTVYTRSFSGTMNTVSLATTSLHLQANLVNNAAQVIAIQNAVASALTSTLNASGANATVTISTDLQSAIVTGFVTAPGPALLPLGASYTAVPSNIVWTSTTATANPNATALQTLVQSTVAAQLFAYVNSLVTQTIASTAGSTAATQVTTATNGLFKSLSPVNQWNALSTDNCFRNLCVDTASCNTCMQSLPAVLVGAVPSSSGTLSLTDASSIAQSFVDTKLAVIAGGGSWPAVATSIGTLVNNNNQQQSATLRSYTDTSAPFYLGRTRLLSDQLQMVASWNKAPLAAYLLQALFKNGPVTSLTAGKNLQLTWNPSVNAAQASRRRRAAIQTSSAVQAQFSYTVSCLPSNTACINALKSSSTLLYGSVLNIFNVALNNFTLAYPKCIIANSVNNQIFDTTCLLQEATTVCNSALSSGSAMTVARQSANVYLNQATVCGSQATYPTTGACYDSSFASAALTAVNQVMGQLVCTLAPSPSPSPSPTSPGITGASTGGGGGGGGLAVAAGAAGGGIILLIVIIVLVVRRRRRNNQSNTGPKAGHDRTVVAFENPMYDDPHTANAQPLYDAAAHKLDSEGLYDEPAFSSSKLKKDNPIYHSHEDLNEGGGYLDTAAANVGGGGGDGYLDVQPGAAGGDDDDGAGGKSEGADSFGFGFAGSDSGAGRSNGEVVYEQGGDAVYSSGEAVYASGDTVYAAPPE